MEELYKKHRPGTFKEVHGQAKAVSLLTKYLKSETLPHAILFTGPSGCGKTTLARILRDKMNCHELDYFEINAAESRGIDMVREIKNKIHLSPTADCRIYYIDEAHKLTNDAQNALLKILEDTPKRSYIFLATTDPSKLITTIKTRCTEIKLAPMEAEELRTLLRGLLEKEDRTVDESVLDKIIECSDNSARRAVVFLDQVLQYENTDQQIRIVESSDYKKVAFDLIKTMLPFKGRAKWAEVAEVLKAIEDQEPEGIRQMVLAVARGQLLKGGHFAARAYLVINCFRDPFYENKNAGNALLAASCWEVVNQDKGG